jgi:hypothetical protein
MLSNLDVVISFATIMLGVSMLVMVGTQTISALFNIRGAQLKTGLEQLFAQAGLDGSKGKEVADAVVLHPLLSDGVLWKRAAPAIQQRELVQVLGLLKAKQFADIKDKLDSAAKTVEEWFDAAMDRVSHRFAGVMRGATIVLSFAIAFALHLDAVDLLSRLSSSAELRQSLVVSAKAVQERAQASLSAAAPNTASPSGADTSTPTALATFTGLLKQAKGIQDDLKTSQFQLVPAPYPGCNFDGHIWGIIASAVLLSLGAPFWFNVLSSASSMRPLLAQKVDDAETKQAAARTT